MEESISDAMNAIPRVECQDLAKMSIYPLLYGILTPTIFMNIAAHEDHWGKQNFL